MVIGCQIKQTTFVNYLPISNSNTTLGSDLFLPDYQNLFKG